MGIFGNKQQLKQSARESMGTHDIDAGKGSVAVAAFGAMTMVFGVSREMWLSLSALALLGGFDMLSVYVRSSLVQLHTPDTMRGRVSAVSGLANSVRVNGDFSRA